MNLLAIYNKTFIVSGRHGKRDVGQAVCAAAVSAGKMRVTLPFRASVSKLKMCGSFIHKSFVNKSHLIKTVECPVNRDFIEVFFPGLPENSFVAERLA